MSQISRVAIHAFAYEAQNLQRSATGLGYAPGAKLPMKGYVVVIETGDGLRGEFSPYMGATDPAMAEARKLAPVLIGRDPFQREAINLQLKINSRAGDGAGVGPLDIALWDLCGKAYGRSVTELLGGFRTRLKTYVSTWRGGRDGGLDSAAAFIAFARDCADRGIRGYKVHSWPEGNADEEAALVRALGEQVGDRLELMHDPACVYRTFETGLAVGRACDEAGFLWIEDPFVDIGRSFHAHRQLRAMISTPLLQGERIRGLEAKAELLMHGGTDILRADPEMDLGITGLLKCAHLAEAFGVDLEIANCSPAQRHCVASVRNASRYEICNVGPDCPNATPPIYACGYQDQIDAIGEDGCVEVPEGPGLGVVYDWDYISAHELGVFEVTVDSLNEIRATPQ